VQNRIPRPTIGEPMKKTICAVTLIILVAAVALAQQSTEANDALVGKSKTPDHRVRDVALSPDGVLAAASYGFSDEGGVTIWKLADRSVVVNLLYGTSQATSIPRIAFSQDGKLFAAATGKGDVLLWTVGQWRSPRTILRQRGDPRDLTFGRNVLGYASETEALLYDLNTAAVTVLAAKGGPADSYNGISFSNDGKLVAVAGRRQSFLWNLETKQKVDNWDVKSFGFFGLGRTRGL